MSLKRQLNHLKNKMVGETIRDYSDITNADDCLSARLNRKSNKFGFELISKNEEHGNLCFKMPLTLGILKALRDLVNDIAQIRKGKSEKNLRLRLRQGEIDLVVTYKLEHNPSIEAQRTAPVTARTYKLLKEMLADAQTILADQECSADEQWSD